MAVDNDQLDCGLLFATRFSPPVFRDQFQLPSVEFTGGRLILMVKSQTNRIL